MRSWIFGIVLGIGLVLQIILGYFLAGNFTLILGLHVLIGLGGLIIVAFILQESWIQRTRFGWGAFAIAAVIAALIFLQVYLGSVLLSSTDAALTAFHEINAFMILAGGVAISIIGRRRRKELEAEFKSMKKDDSQP